MTGRSCRLYNRGMRVSGLLTRSPRTHPREASLRGRWLASAPIIVASALVATAHAGDDATAPAIHVDDTPAVIEIETRSLRARIAKEGYVSGIQAGSFEDRATGTRDLGFGLDVADWIMEPGSDREYRDRLPPELVYEYGTLHHGDLPKRGIEGPQICTQARRLQPTITRGPDFVAVEHSFRFTIAAPGRRAGSLWTQRLVFPAGTRYYLSMHRIDSVNDSPAMFLRIDMPGHIRHAAGDRFAEVFLSTHGRIPAAEFRVDFPPDARFLYRRGKDPLPRRMIRAYRPTRADGAPGPWLAGMTLDPEVVSEAWCHQRGYVCMIEEFGGFPVRAGESFSAAFLVGYFDSIADMEAAYDRHRGARRLEVEDDRWRLLP